MVDVSVNLKELEQVVDLSTQLANVSRRLSQGSYTMGLISEYSLLADKLGALIGIKLGDYDAIVSDLDEAVLKDYNNIEVTNLCNIMISDNKLETFKLSDPTVACIKTHVFQGANGSFTITVSNGAITNIEFIPKEG